MLKVYSNLCILSRTILKYAAVCFLRTISPSEQPSIIPHSYWGNTKGEFFNNAAITELYFAVP